MSCPNKGVGYIYKSLGTSIYSKKCNISNSQRLFTTNLPAYHQLDISTRNCHNKRKGEKRNKKQLSHSDIINIQVSQSYYDPKSFRRLK